MNLMMNGMHFRLALILVLIDIRDRPINHAIELQPKKHLTSFDVYIVSVRALYIDAHVSDYLSLACEDWQCSARRLQGPGTGGQEWTGKLITQESDMGSRQHPCL